MWGTHLHLGDNRFRECYGLFFEDFAVSTVIDSRPSHSRPGQGIPTVHTDAHAAPDRPIFGYVRKLLVYRTGHGPYAAAGYA